MLAPVCLFVYNRANHTQQTIEALLANKLSEQTELYIYSDGSKNKEDDSSVIHTRKYIKTIQGFKKITIIERDKNWGLAQNIIDGVTQVIDIHSKVIVLEDDMVTSPAFLTFMNQGLEKYQQESQIISIHGYMFPIANLPSSFFMRGSDCWGWATWKRGWDLFQPNAEILLDEMLSKNLTYDFDFYGTHSYTEMLKQQITGAVNSWAIRWYASAYLQNKLTLFPGKSFVKNIGLDNSGTHEERSTAMNIFSLANEIPSFPEFISENTLARKKIANYLNQINNSKFFKIKSFLREKCRAIFK